MHNTSELPFVLNANLFFIVHDIVWSIMSLRIIGGFNRLGEGVNNLHTQVLKTNYSNQIYFHHPSPCLHYTKFLVSTRIPSTSIVFIVCSYVYS